MTYLVMETHLSYAVAMDENGRFLKVANMGYTVGQRLNSVVVMAEPEAKKVNIKKLISIAVAAAVLTCLLLMSSWQVFGYPVGTVRIQINPDVLIKVNRFDRVVAAEGLNADGRILLKGEKLFGKRVSEASDILADRAVELGYLSEGGEIKITVDSKNTEWKKQTEEKIVIEIDIHFASKIKVRTENKLLDDTEESGDATEAQTQAPETQIPSEPSSDTETVSSQAQTPETKPYVHDDDEDDEEDDDDDHYDGSDDDYDDEEDDADDDENDSDDDDENEEADEKREHKRENGRENKKYEEDDEDDDEDDDDD